MTRARQREIEALFRAPEYADWTAARVGALELSTALTRLRATCDRYEGALEEIETGTGCSSTRAFAAAALASNVPQTGTPEAASHEAESAPAAERSSP